MGMFDFLTKKKKKSTQEQQQESTTTQDLTTTKLGEERVGKETLAEQISRTEATTKTDQQIAAERAGTTLETGTQQQQTQQQLLSSGVLDQLEAQFGKQIAAGGGSMTDAIQRLRESADFDVGGFVEGITGGAERVLTKATEGDINLMSSAAGGGATTNSAVAALAAEMRADKEARLAGIKGEAVARGTEIERGGLTTLLGAAQAESGGALDIAQILKGAEVTGTQTGLTETTGATTDISQQQVTGEQRAVTEAEQRTAESTELLKQIQELMRQEGVSTTEATATGTATGESTGSVLDAITQVVSLFKPPQ